ncbi:MAG: hypothetical protein LBK07_11225 [Tannerella sp.]|jgi:hypothetical protein|nr:hypothetical protein [Tannerella sp.]
MKLFMIVCMAAICSSLPGQERDAADRRWALHYSGGIKPLIRPVQTERPPRYSPGNAGSSLAVTGEYCLPGRWNLLAGYYRTEVQNGYGTRSMEGLRFGAKRYFLPSHTVFQPYLAGMGEWNWGRHAEWRRSVPASGIDAEAYSLNPRLSLIPGAGFELYLLSCLALTAEYGFNIGMASHSNAKISGDVIRDRGMFHSVSLGLKITFPFSLTWEDADNLLYILQETLWSMVE